MYNLVNRDCAHESPTCSRPSLTRPLTTRRERISIHDAIATPRCPWCRHFLIARVGRHGLYWFCGCPETVWYKRAA